MGDTIDKALGSVIRGLTEEKYAQSLAAYLFWLDIGQTYYQIPSDQVLNVIWNNRATTDSINPHNGQLIHSTAHLILRFARDAESGHIAVPHSSGLQSRLCARTLRGFFSNNAETMMSARELSDSWVGDAVGGFHADVNLVAHWANLGYIEEASIRDHILQSLIYQPPLWTHHADALIILFKLAGATFGKYTDPSVLDRCFELLKAHHYYHDLEKVTLVQVGAPCGVKGGHRTKTNIQEVIALRERGWEGLPPPPVFTTRESKPVGTNQKDPAATPVATFLGLPSTDIEPEVTQSPPHESITVLEEDTIPAAPVTPVTHSPSISIATLSDFTIADASDDESFIDPAIRATSDDETPVDPADATPHEIFYLEDGNVEVLCGSTLFRVNISTLSFHSPVLRRMFAKSSLATAESPNGCPRILSSDTAKDFTTLLKVIYLPGFVTLPACRWIVSLTARLSTGSLNGIKCQISPHSRPSSGSQQSMRCPLSDPSYSRLFVMHTQIPLRGWPLPRRLEREFSVGRLLIRTRSSISLSSRS